MERINFENTANGLVLSFDVTIPNYVPTGFEANEPHSVREGFISDIIGSFSKLLIGSLKRRMSACRTNLLNHLENCTAHNGQVITWKRKDGSEGSFSIVSFQTMESAILCLQQGCYLEFSKNKSYVEQTIKALMNDTEQDHSNSGEFRYSELVSILLSLLRVE